MVNCFLGTNMTREKNISLSRKLKVYFLLSAIFISSIGIGIFFYQSYIFLKSDITKSFDRVESFAIPKIKKELRINNISKVNSILEILSSSQDYGYISLSIKLDDQKSFQKIFRKGFKKESNQKKSFSFYLNNNKNQKVTGNLTIFRKKIFRK